MPDNSPGSWNPDSSPVSGGWLQYSEYVLRELIDLNNQLKELRRELHGDNQSTGIFNRLGSIEAHIKAKSEEKKSNTMVIIALITSVGTLLAVVLPHFLK